MSARRGGAAQSGPGVTADGGSGAGAPVTPSGGAGVGLGAPTFNLESLPQPRNTGMSQNSMCGDGGGGMSGQAISPAVAYQSNRVA